MSDSVVKLRIDSKEYDANIKRAGDALTQYFQKVLFTHRPIYYVDCFAGKGNESLPHH